MRLRGLQPLRRRLHAEMLLHTGAVRATGPGIDTVAPFVAGTRYRAGELVFYNGSLYEANVNDPTGTPAHRRISAL